MFPVMKKDKSQGKNDLDLAHKQIKLICVAYHAMADPPRDFTHCIKFYKRMKKTKKAPPNFFMQKMSK